MATTWLSLCDRTVTPRRTGCRPGPLSPLPVWPIWRTLSRSRWPVTDGWRPPDTGTSCQGVASVPCPEPT
jgi:hypothetical protein